MTSLEVRRRLARALCLDLIGPESTEPQADETYVALLERPQHEVFLLTHGPSLAGAVLHAD